MPAATKQRAAERRRQARAEKKKDGMGSVVGCMMCWGPVLFLSGCTYAAQYYSYQAVHDEMVSRYSAAVAGWQEEGREVLLNGAPRMVSLLMVLLLLLAVVLLLLVTLLLLVVVLPLALLVQLLPLPLTLTSPLR